ncbi:MAG: hypothetical protein AMK73_04730 [Planctomycetes bacterium SM23_32]|nr:MAG: hypothetical protein AMK73_04730 [Planctomycetes bacterium SM23_32]
MKADPRRPGGRGPRIAVGLAVALLALLTVALPACADSIWDRRERSFAFLYTDNLAAEVGDSITVIINDKSTFKKDDERQLEKTSDSSGSATIETPVVDVGITSTRMTESSSRSFAGSDEYDASWEFVDSVTATVVDKLPNGNLVVAGRSERNVRGEEVVTILTGIVKPEDVTASNTVLSSRIARLRVYYEVTGTSEAYLKPGFLSRVLNLIWPF